MQCRLPASSATSRPSSSRTRIRCSTQPPTRHVKTRDALVQQHIFIHSITVTLRCVHATMASFSPPWTHDSTSFLGYLNVKMDFAVLNHTQVFQCSVAFTNPHSVVLFSSSHLANTHIVDRLQITYTPIRLELESRTCRAIVYDIPCTPACLLVACSRRHTGS